MFALEPTAVIEDEPWRVDARCADGTERARRSVLLRAARRHPAGQGVLRRVPGQGRVPRRRRRAARAVGRLGWRALRQRQGAREQAAPGPATEGAPARAGARGARPAVRPVVPRRRERLSRTSTTGHRRGGSGRRAGVHLPPVPQRAPIRRGQPVRYPRSPRAFSSVGESAALTRRRSGVRDPQRPRVVAIFTTFAQVTRYFACPVAQIGSSLLSNPD